MNDLEQRLSYYYGASTKITDIVKDECLQLKDIIAIQINKIKDIKKDKFLLWSGGIDSTVVLYALIENKVDFTLVLTENSFKEYPLVAYRLVTGFYGNIPYIKTEDVSSLKGVLITGEFADQLVGSNEFVNYSLEERRSHYKDVLEKYLTDGIEDEVIKQLETNDLNTAEFLWAVNYIYKYEALYERYNYLSSQEFFHFFDSKEFKAWSYCNYKINCNYDDYKSYKKVFKDFIFKLNGDKVYRDHKVKIPSLRKQLFRKG